MNKKLEIIIDGKPVYSGTPWNFVVYEDDGTQYVTVIEPSLEDAQSHVDELAAFEVETIVVSCNG